MPHPNGEQRGRFRDAGTAAGQEDNGVAVAALVVGILAALLVILIFPLGDALEDALVLLVAVACLLFIAAIALGVLGRAAVTSGRTTQGKGIATAGLALGIIGLPIAMFLLYLAVLAGAIRGPIM